MKKIFCVLACTLGFISGPAFCDVWEERESLERYLDHFEKLQELLDEAEVSADPNRRVKLQYDALRRDGNELMLRVRHYLDAPTQPYRNFRVEYEKREQEIKG
ncbi:MULTISPECIES: RAQPRD family integrative conjugative element protein [Vibrio]|uniref:RAQPRD family integrative conjugative element protein n=1 Tax=Vibrio TaxID=662 RepID=UPI0014958A2F|nr:MULTISPECIES: RAQPRD family integrative conjugative element protein [Vibrio]USD58524.1 hypothetical protein J4N44_27915 [Vibrio sp. SCSIO 43155]